MEGTLLNNRYSILKALNRGCLSQTFLAIDLDASSPKKCVIKKLKLVTHLQKQQWMQAQFQKEAEALKKLSADNNQIPQFYAYFSAGETFYLVQEWIEGITLKQKQRLQRILTEQQVRKILISLLLVLDYIHSRHIIHQDIKPENVILRAADGLPILIDFGAVIEAINLSKHNSQNLMMKMGTGTPGYMPPEQISGHSVFASDLYSLGLTAIYLLTGKTPQELDTDWDTGEIIWHPIADNLSNHLVTVINTAIRLRLSDRFASAQEMLTALQYQSAILYHIPTLLSTTSIQSENTTIIADTYTQESSFLSAKSELEIIKNAPQKKKIPHKILSLLMFVSVGVGVIFFGITSISFKPVSQHSALKLSASKIPEILYPAISLTSPLIPSLSVPSPIWEESLANSTNIRTFAIGTTQEEIFNFLGEPTWRRQGYWADSIAWSYQDILPDKVDLGYLFDINTNKLRQTEVSFASSVSLAKMQNTLNNMLSGNISSVASEGLEQVYNRQINLQEFRVGDLEGIIQRNEEDRIYIGVWENDFHR